MPLALAMQGNGRAEPKAEVWYPRGAAAARKPGSRPVLFYFSGWGGIGIDSGAAIAALVLRGFVVITIIYPGKAPPPMDFSSDTAFQQSTRTAVDRVRTRAEDAIRVLDTLESRQGRTQLGPLAQRLDLDRVGVFGYSFGGAVAAETAWMDSRFKAAANLDGWQFAEASEYGIKQPYLLMSDATPLPTAAELHSSNAVVRDQAILTERDYRLMTVNMSRHGGIYAVLAGSTHGTIAAGNPRWPARLLIGLGLIEPPRTQRIVSTCLVEFFEQSLGLRADQPVSTWAARFAQLRLEIHPRPASLR
ncbi:MAG TPA: dienelactone hydrolase family protein [Steroidobacteraceae bacterium]|nr:dienelactone hydrolase family protein [Steroidobacteraceae bacterium]